LGFNNSTAADVTVSPTHLSDMTHMDNIFGPALELTLTLTTVLAVLMSENETDSTISSVAANTRERILKLLIRIKFLTKYIFHIFIF